MLQLFSKKPAQKKKKLKGKDAFISTFVDNYLQITFRELEDQKVKEVLKGVFANLKYTLTGYDPSALSYIEKIKLIEILFNLNSKEKGAVTAKSELEDIGLKVKGRLGVVNAFNEALKDLPEGVFSIHRIEGLDAKELQQKLKDCLFELEQAKSIADKSVAEQTVSLSAEKNVLEAILYNASDGVFALDRQGRVITFNQAMETLTGYTFDEVHIKQADEVIRLFEEANPLETRLYCAMPGTNLNRVAYESAKLTLVARNGGKKFVRMTSTTIPHGKEVNIGCIVTLKDITKDIDLETMKLDFVSMAAHELRTPLTALRGYLSFLIDDIKDDLDKLHSEYLEKSVVSADRLLVLVENLLNISRIERGTLVLEKTKQSWVPLVKDIVEEFQTNAITAEVTLNYTESKSTIPDVYADRTMVSEVISNLIDNSLRYTPAGGRITVFVEEVDNQVITHIKDTGIGVPQASLPHLFKKFYRVSTVLKEGKKGTGLGLFISKEIVKLHKGNIWVESEEGQGSTFSFSLPVASGSEESRK